MRVIAGQKRGLKLESPQGDNVRPTTDRVKENLFNIIAPYVTEARVLDLFSGSGALGIEAISRGAEHVIFCDNSRSSLSTTEKNIRRADFSDQATVKLGDYDKNLKAFAKEGLRFDIIFMDPPYYKGLIDDSLRLISEGGLLANDGIVVIEHDKGVKIDEQILSLRISKQKKYGITMITIMKED